MNDRRGLRIYLVSNATGGEFLHLARVAQLIGCKIYFFWDSLTNKPNVGLEEFPAYCLVAFKLVRIVERTLGKMQPNLSSRISLSKVLFTKVLISRYRIPNGEGVNLVSTGFMPLPKGRRILAYVLTPPREITTSYNQMVSNLKIPNFMKFLLPMYRAVYWRIYAKSLRNASAVVTNSATVQRRLKRYFQVDSDVLYPSIDIQEFTNLGYHKYFLHVSRLQREKRQEYAIASFERFLTERKDFSLVIAGTWGYNLEDSRSYLKQLQRHVEEKQLPVRFVVNPARKELLDLYANAYACLFTAEEEDLGLVPLEAMASGKPVISVNEGGPTETIIDGVNGFLVNSTGQMAEKMFYLVENPSIVRQMGDEGQRHVRAKFSDQIFRERLDKIIARMKKQNV